MPRENKDLQRTAQIVTAYLRHYKLSGDQLGTLIPDVHQTLGRLGQAPKREAERIPAVSIRRSADRTGIFRTPVGAGKAAWIRAQWARRETQGKSCAGDRSRFITSSAAAAPEAELEISA